MYVSEPSAHHHPNGSRSTLTTVDGAVHWQGRTPAGAPVDGDPVEAIAKTLQMLYTEPDPTLPPLTSGLVGYLGWDVVRHWEHLPFPPADDVNLPEFALNMVSDMAIHDNKDGTVLLVANAIDLIVHLGWVESERCRDARE